MLIVKKFGGSSVADAERINNVADRCIEDYSKGNKVVVVLSAMGKTTDALLNRAQTIHPNPPRRELDMLLATGEQTSVALMAMAMARKGVPAISLNAWQVAMHTTSNYGNARFKRIDSERILNELDSGRIVIVTGFQGVNRRDDLTTLGRLRDLYGRGGHLYGGSAHRSACEENERDHLRRDAGAGDSRRKGAAQSVGRAGQEIRSDVGGAFEPESAGGHYRKGGDRRGEHAGKRRGRRQECGQDCCIRREE